MAGPKARVIDGLKFMWDGRSYDSAEEAATAAEAYGKEKFETRLVEEDGQVHVYTRRVVTEVEVDGPPPM